MKIKTLQELKQCFEQNEKMFGLLLKFSNFSCAEEKEAIKSSIEANKGASFIIGQEIEMKKTKK